VKPTPPPPLDQALLDSLEASIGPETMGVMMMRLLEESQRLETELAALVTAGDSEQAVAVAHEVKGMFANVGCMLAAALAARVEAAARAGRGADVRALVPALCQAMNQASHYLAGKYPKL
jgi:HPt (histidine-containing phosphotransfer) domain-containing protein